MLFLLSLDILIPCIHLQIGRNRFAPASVQENWEKRYDDKIITETQIKYLTGDWSLWLNSRIKKHFFKSDKTIRASCLHYFLKNFPTISVYTMSSMHDASSRQSFQSLLGAFCLIIFLSEPFFSSFHSLYCVQPWVNGSIGFK